jgi:hypothetical protein
LRFILYKNQYASGSDSGDIQRVPHQVFNSWEDYITILKEAEERTYERNSRPAIWHATATNQLRSLDRVQSITAIVLDCDGAQSLDRVRAYTDQAKHRWALQARLDASGVYKYHLIMPFDEPIQYDSTWHGRAGSVIKHFSDLIGDPYDMAMATATAVTALYTKRPGQPDPFQTRVAPSSNRPIQIRTLLRKVDIPRIAIPTFRPEPQDTNAPPFQNELTVLFKADPVNYMPRKGAYRIECPKGHATTSRTKTFLYPNRVVCMAGSCRGQPLSYFTEKLEVPRHAPPTQIQHKSDHTERLQAAFADLNPVSTEAVVCRVTTGAGKSRAATEYLARYSEPIEGAPGRTAILATPTNSLLHELAQRIPTEHRRQTGVLAVLNEDGNPACKKYEQARTLQAAGGDIHRMLCAKCEYRDGCRAREGRATGQGGLTVTNHALLPTVAQELHSKNRWPMLVWDESPQWVDTELISHSELTWLREKITAPTVYDVTHIEILPSRAAEAIIPVMTFFQHNPKQQVTTAEALAEEWYNKIPYHAVILKRVLAKYNIPNTGTVLERLRKCFDQIRKTPVEYGFDALPRNLQFDVLRSVKVTKAVEAALTPGAVLRHDVAGWLVTNLSRNATTYRDYGGIVLDATAVPSLIQRIRPDAKVIDIDVPDALPTERIYITRQLSRKALETSPHLLTQAVQDAAKYVDPGKTLAFTYRSHIDAVKNLPGAEGVEWWYFGNTRGHDSWYGRGFTTFLTFGDPIPNLGAVSLTWSHLDPALTGWSQYAKELTVAELKQAHGRARDPQVGSRTRITHIHYGAVDPWQSDT